MPQFRLPWSVDLKGYEVRAGRAAKKRPDASKKLKRLPRSAVIVARGGDPGFYDAMECDGLYHRFAAFPATQRGALDFVTEYGLLGKGRMGEVNEICAHIRRVKELIGYKEERDWNRLRE